MKKFLGRIKHVRYPAISAGMLSLTILAATLYIAIPLPLLNVVKVNVPVRINAAQRPLVEVAKAEEIHVKPSLGIRIPTIGIDTKIEQVGLTPDGAVDVPKNEQATGWFNRSPRPGEIGSAVMDGHFGLSDGTLAVFAVFDVPFDFDSMRT